MNFTNFSQICITVTGETLPLFLRNVKKAQKLSSLIELRVDTIHDLSPNDVDEIYKHVNASTIFTCRDKKEGGEFLGTFKMKKELIKKALPHATYIDVEYSNEALSQGIPKSQLLISFHDLSKTPKYEVLEKLFEEMKKLRPRFIKIATQVNAKEDISTLTKLLLHFPEDNKVIIGMGEEVKWTRIFFPFLGSAITYVALGEGSRTAPGQITFSEMNRFLSLLG